MFFIELDEGHETLADIKLICQHLVEHRDLLRFMSQKQLDDLSVILAPTLDRDQDEDEKRQHWQHLLNNFVVFDDDKQPIRFYREPTTQRLYLADPEGLATLPSFIEHELHPESLKHKTLK